MITFNFADFTTPCLDLIEALEIQLPAFANDHGIISTFCQIDDATHEAVGSLMSFVVGNATVNQVCNALLTGEWVVTA